MNYFLFRSTYYSYTFCFDFELLLTESPAPCCKYVQSHFSRWSTLRESFSSLTFQSRCWLDYRVFGSLCSPTCSSANSWPVTCCNLSCPSRKIDDFETNQVTNGGRPGGVNTPTPLLWEMSGSFLSPPLPSARLGCAALMSVAAADRRAGHRGRALIDVRRWRWRSVRTNVDECLGAAAAWNELWFSGYDITFLLWKTASFFVNVSKKKSSERDAPRLSGARISQIVSLRILHAKVDKIKDHIQFLICFFFFYLLGGEGSWERESMIALKLPETD